MEYINGAMFYDLGQALEACFLFAKLPLKNCNQFADKARSILRLLMNGMASYRLDVSFPAADDLVIVLDGIVSVCAENGETVLTDLKLQDFNNKFWAFNNALALELGRAPIFYVTPKGVFDTRRLVLDGAAVFEGYLDRLPQEAINDANQSARCLAFALPTAAGFHIARSVEAVMKRQMVAFGCPAAKQSQRNWGNYIKSLREHGANGKVLHHLEQLKDLHRNPMIHPEVTLEMPEALGLWSMCTSAIQAMVADMETKSATPSKQIMAMIPGGGRSLMYHRDSMPSCFYGASSRQSPSIGTY